MIAFTPMSCRIDRRNSPSPPFGDLPPPMATDRLSPARPQAREAHCNAGFRSFRKVIMIDKIFKANDVRATTPSPLDTDAAWKVGHAAGLYLKRSRQNLPAAQKTKREDAVVVGRDMRPTSPALAKALIDGLRSIGMNVIDVGMVDTSFIYFAINHFDCVGGVMVTASHNPINYNGFKISGPKAKPIGSSSGLDDIKRIASTLRVGFTGVLGKYEEQDLWEQYRQHVLQFLDLKRKIRVAVDGSNGMAGKMVPQVFENQINLEIIPMLFETDGVFVHDPNPLVESNMDMLKAKVAETQPDLGVCFDGDADRCFFVDENGKAIGCDLVTAILAQDFLKQPRQRRIDDRLRPALEPRRWPMRSRRRGACPSASASATPS